MTLANDIKAVNRFMAAGKQVQDSTTTNSTVTEMMDMDYIMCVFFRYSFFRPRCLCCNVGVAQCQISLLELFGLS